MIKLHNIKKIFRTEEIETWALREVSLEVKDMLCGTFFLFVSSHRKQSFFLLYHNEVCIFVQEIRQKYNQWLDRQPVTVRDELVRLYNERFNIK